MSKSSILVADVGGTNARIAYLPETWQPGARLDEDSIVQMGSVEFDSFEDFVRAALARLGVDSEGMEAVFSVAGPVTDGRVRLTNLNWQPADETQLRQVFKFHSCGLVNDLVAATWGLTGFAAASPAGETLQTGNAAAGARNVLLNVGTGLGAAYWSGQGAGFRVDGSEAGHVGFAPPIEAVGLFENLQERYGRVSWERVLAGNGLAEMHRYYSGENVQSASGVTKLAQKGDEAALDTIAHFSRLLGVYAGDLALGAPAFGGVSLIGGVIGGLESLLATNLFLEGFVAKGRMEGLLREVPVFRVREPRLGLIGAWRLASAAASVE